MEDLKTIVGKNLSALRKKRKITQIELAEKFNYTDKAVSKWEQGSTLPDLETLKQLADFYGVTIDYLTNPENIAHPHYDPSSEKATFINHITITCLTASIVWMIATIIYVYPPLFQKSSETYWPIFIWAVPVTAFIIIICDIAFFNKNKLCLFICESILVWSALTAFYLHFLLFANGDYNLWLIFITGIPMQIIIILYFLLKKKQSS